MVVISDILIEPRLNLNLLRFIDLKKYVCRNYTEKKKPNTVH